MTIISFTFCTGMRTKDGRHCFLFLIIPQHIVQSFGIKQESIRKQKMAEDLREWREELESREP